MVDSRKSFRLRQRSVPKNRGSCCGVCSYTSSRKLIVAKLLLTDLKSVCYADWLEGAINNPCMRHCFTTSGYEGRAISWTARTLEESLSRDHLRFHTVGFEDFRDTLSRRANDMFYAQAEIAVRQCGSSR